MAAPPGTRQSNGAPLVVSSWAHCVPILGPESLLVRGGVMAQTKPLHPLGRVPMGCKLLQVKEVPPAFGR